MRPGKRDYSQGKTSISSEVSAGSPVFELHLRGLRLEEAMKKFERQLDYAVMQGLYEFQVVHGKGEGILQRAIHEYLAKNSFVEDYFFSSPSQGGFGKTIVRLKRAQ
ncbi:Endonuclease MutS2 [subsurface metagenome]